MGCKDTSREEKAKEAAQHLAQFEALTDSPMVETDMEAVRETAGVSQLISRPKKVGGLVREPQS